MANIVHRYMTMYSRNTRFTLGEIPKLYPRFHVSIVHVACCFPKGKLDVMYSCHSAKALLTLAGPYHAKKNNKNCAHLSYTFQINTPIINSLLHATQIVMSSMLVMLTAV